MSLDLVLNMIIGIYLIAKTCLTMKPFVFPVSEAVDLIFWYIGVSVWLKMKEKIANLEEAIIDHETLRGEHETE